MRVERVYAATQIEHDVVSIDIRDVDRFWIGQAAGLLIFEWVVDADDSAIGDRKNLRAITDVAMNIGRVAVDELSVLVELHPVNREPLGKIKATVAGDAAGAVHTDGAATVESYPPGAGQRCD